MSRTKSRYMASALMLALLALSSFSMAGGSNQHMAGTPLFVPDSNNNRVLIYYPPFTTDQSASYVLGQTNFNTTSAGSTASTMNAPDALALDSRGNLWVSDRLNCRVLEFRTPLMNGLAASHVIGEPNLSTPCANGGSPTQNVVGQSGGVAFDSHGNLWVADMQSSRVLRFSPPFNDGMAANLVLGQPDFTSGSCNQSSATNPPPTRNTLCHPAGLAFDADGRLWVADSDNNRVLAYQPPFKTNMNASAEIGQPAATAFTSNTANNPTLSAASLTQPDAVAVDGQNNLWVADTGNNRVLRYKPRCGNREAATLVLGQPNFTSNATVTPPSAATLNSPEGLVIDPKAGVFVGDTLNNRTLLFTSPFHNGMNAEFVLGQLNFTGNSSNQGGTANEKTQNAPFEAGPSLLALGVLGGLVTGREFLKRLRSRQ